jgi:hypothetical protein
MDSQLRIARIPVRLGKVHISRQQGSSRNVRAKLSFLTLHLAIQCHVLSVVKLTSFQQMVLPFYSCKGEYILEECALWTGLTC